MLKIIQEKQVQYTDIIDLFQVQNVSKLYIQCNFFTDLGGKSYGITYKDSTNLKYNGIKIHSNYNSWVRNLDRAIQTEMARMVSQ